MKKYNLTSSQIRVLFEFDNKGNIVFTNKNIHLDSYLQTLGFMIIFGIIVSVGVHFALKKIDVIESLKSVE